MGISPYLRELRDKIGSDPVMIPGIAAVVQNDRGEVLLQRASYDGNWHIIGGAMDPDEQPADAVVREVYEETGLHIRPDRLACVYTLPRTVYPNGDVVIYTAITFACTIIGGHFHIHDDESLELAFFAPDAMPVLRDDEQLLIDYTLSGATGAFAPPEWTP
jgi:8-oxo-dGTP pyrophosphatase MutT (NUDIX family)